MPVIEVAAAVLVWVGAALVVLADARRGLALGLALVTIGFAVLAWGAGQPAGAVALTLGGMTGALRCWTARPAAWGLMPPGSTSRMVLCVAAGLLALWISASVTTVPGAPVLFAVLVVLGLMAARVLAGRDAVVDRTAIACFSLALASSPALASSIPTGPVPYIFGALIAAAVMVVPAALPQIATRPGKDGG
jgi:hypothetical protein